LFFKPIKVNSAGTVLFFLDVVDRVFRFTCMHSLDYWLSDCSFWSYFL